ncbi:hypothetical protein IMG5_048590 [Ichthyophthirius multifiliis]|uniref:Transmembrane protein n=1 Tax=Ichthyophthirius multifiliis TaxID=5932 RepID=G0QMG7_ICHMU|nr:hypothetical protein IMG5_048590 [Ichthyophthirius multifiliis]EGR33589.1 hypothetical protein IMG5_048590 [Ichthyophthirius multifiliis]|eukprot:XP_004037575.1 hypothetical protein IMG5_048590 [Ichthyophthirius multifiliis]
MSMKVNKFSENIPEIFKNISMSALLIFTSSFISYRPFSFMPCMTFQIVIFMIIMILQIFIFAFFLFFNYCVYLLFLQEIVICILSLQITKNIIIIVYLLLRICWVKILIISKKIWILILFQIKIIIIIYQKLLIIIIIQTIIIILSMPTNLLLLFLCIVQRKLLVLEVKILFFFLQ